MTENFSIPKWSARNPLGIVALFISLIYAMSAILLGVAVTNLSAINQTILVTFIVVFPFVVLAVFAWLVANHHKKLYGPGDYRSDEGFLNAGGPISPQEFRQRIDETVDIAIDEDGGEQTAGNKPSISPARTNDAEPADLRRETTDRSDIAARAYLAEGLAIQELQADLGGQVFREFPILWNGRRLIFDGLVGVGRDWFIIETKFVRRASALARIVSQFSSQARVYRDALEGKVAGSIQVLLALVIDEPLQRSYADQIVQKYASVLDNGISVRVFEFGVLAGKYGVAGQKGS